LSLLCYAPYPSAARPRLSVRAVLGECKKYDEVANAHAKEVAAAAKLQQKLTKATRLDKRRAGGSTTPWASTL
jgi:hypothetical protein